MEKQFFQQEGKMPYLVTASAVPIGDDLVVMIWGGETPHIGAVSVSIPRPSLKNSAVIRATTSVYAMIGHKEDELAKEMGQKIASALNKNVVLTAGIHVEDLSDDGIKLIETNCRIIVESLIGCYL